MCVCVVVDSIGFNVHLSYNTPGICYYDGWTGFVPVRALFAVTAYAHYFGRFHSFQVFLALGHRHARDGMNVNGAFFCAVSSW